MTAVAAVVPNRDGLGLVGRCVRAALQAGAAEVVVVDDGSTDASPDEARAAGARVVPSPGRGFAAAVNAGVRATTAELVLVLNSDCFVDPDAIERLATAVLGDPALGLCGAALRFEDGRRSSTHGRLLTPALAVAVALSLPRPAPREGSGLQRVGFVPLACALARRDRWDAVGGLDERFFFYFEDHDLCRRLADAGSAVAVCWDAGAVHVEGGSSRASDPSGWFRVYAAGRMRYLRKHHPLGWLAFAAVWAPVCAAHAAVWAARRRPDSRVWARTWLAAASAGVRD